jgi:hypothetical protein
MQTLVEALPSKSRLIDPAINRDSVAHALLRAAFALMRTLQA